MRDETYRQWGKEVKGHSHHYEQLKITVKGRVYRRSGGNWLRWNEFDNLSFRGKLAEVTHYAESHGYARA